MATISSVMIANMALGHVGTRSTIESFTENSVEAQQCKLWYDWSRLDTLEAANWPFARHRQAFAEHSDAPPDEWLYRYQWPADCVAMRRIWNPAGRSSDAIPYELETSSDGTQRTILTNQAEAVGVYTRDISVTSVFTAGFVLALSWVLASKIAFSITGKRIIAQTAENAAIQLKRLAAANALNQEVMEEPRDADWIRGR